MDREKPRTGRKKRTTINIERALWDKAHKMMASEDRGNFTAFVEELVRERWKLLQQKLSATPAAEAAPSPDHKTQPNRSGHKSKRFHRGD
jgi:hypothetical protein